MEIFYRCDLNGNGYLSREEFDIFQKRTSGEECDDAAWQVVQGNIILWRIQDELRHASGNMRGVWSKTRE